MPTGGTGVFTGGPPRAPPTLARSHAPPLHPRCPEPAPQVLELKLDTAYDRFPLDLSLGRFDNERCGVCHPTKRWHRGADRLAEKRAWRREWDEAGWRARRLGPQAERLTFGSSLGVPELRSSRKAALSASRSKPSLPGDSDSPGTVCPWTRKLLLRRALEAGIEAWEHPLIDDRDEAAAEVGLMLQDVVRDQLAEAISAYSSLDGVKELSARDAARRGRNNVTPGAASTVRVGGEASIFHMPTSEPQFVRRMETPAGSTA